MSNIDINISRTFTINTGNYQSIKPSVNLTIKDIPVEKVSDVYLELSNVLEGMMRNEILKCHDEVGEIATSLGRYCQTVRTNLSNIGGNVETSLNTIEELLK